MNLPRWRNFFVWYEITREIQTVEIYSIRSVLFEINFVYKNRSRRIDFNSLNFPRDFKLHEKGLPAREIQNLLVYPYKGLLFITNFILDFKLFYTRLAPKTPLRTCWHCAFTSVFLVSFANSFYLVLFYCHKMKCSVRKKIFPLRILQPRKLSNTFESLSFRVF